MKNDRHNKAREAHMMPELWFQSCIQWSMFPLIEHKIQRKYSDVFKAFWVALFAAWRVEEKSMRCCEVDNSIKVSATVKKIN